MRKQFPTWVAGLSVLCTVGCGGAAPTNVTPSSTPDAPMNGPTPGGPPPGGGPAPDPNPNPTPGGPNPNPGPNPSPGPNPNPNPNPTPAPGEMTWTVERAAGGDPIAAVWGASAGDVWAVGGKTILHSTGDGSWTTDAVNADDSYAAVFGADGWVYVGGGSCAGGVCQGGLLLRSSDGGATWSRQAIGYGVSGFSAGAGGVVYLDSADLYASHDHFATSEKLPLTWATSVGVLAHESALFVYGGLRGSAIRRSTDGGQTWTTVYQGWSGSQSGEMDGMARGDKALFAVANGCSVPACVGAVLRSDDGGSTWTLGPRIADWVRGPWAPSDSEVWIGGAKLMRSTDGGASFGAVTLPTATTVRALWGASADELYAVGDDGSILHGKR